MTLIHNKKFDEERALYGSDGVKVVSCSFDGPADGESALKESRNVVAENCFFNLRYPFWHDTNVKIAGCELTPLCRAALWYSEGVEIEGSKLFGIKALRECRDVTVADTDIDSAEFGWMTKNISMTDSRAAGEYFMFNSRGLRFTGVSLKGKYSFQYTENCVFEDCNFDTKDAFWHGKNIVVRNSVVKGEYLAWYAENITFENCKIIGTQPLCYCKGLKLINCTLVDCDLAFEKSEVEATLENAPVSIKNPKSGRIVTPAGTEIILDEATECEIVWKK